MIRHTKIIKQKKNWNERGIAVGLILRIVPQNLAEFLPVQQTFDKFLNLSQWESNWGIGWLENKNSIGRGSRGGVMTI